MPSSYSKEKRKYCNQGKMAQVLKMVREKTIGYLKTAKYFQILCFASARNMNCLQLKQQPSNLEEKQCWAHILKYFSRIHFQDGKQFLWLDKNRCSQNGIYVGKV